MAEQEGSKMAERKTLREIFIDNMGEDSADIIMERLECLAKAGASGPVIEYALRKELAEFILGRRVGVTPLIGIGVFAGAGLGVGIGVAIGRRLVAPV